MEKCGYARRYHLNEIILLIMHTSDHGASGRPVVEAAYYEIISKCVAEASANARSPFDALADKVKSLGRKLYPDDNAFPVHFIISKLEQISLQRTADMPIPNTDWIISTLVDIKIPYSYIFQVYHEIFEAKVV